MWKWPIAWMLINDINLYSFVIPSLCSYFPSFLHSFLTSFRAPYWPPCWPLEISLVSPTKYHLYTGGAFQSAPIVVWMLDKWAWPHLVWRCCEHFNLMYKTFVDLETGGSIGSGGAAVNQTVQRSPEWLTPDRHVSAMSEILHKFHALFHAVVKVMWQI